jgi:hypothetical protein
MVIPAGQQSCPRRSTHRCSMEPCVFQAVPGETLKCRSSARPTKRARRPKASIVEQDNHDIRRTLRRTHLRDRGKRRVRIRRIVRNSPCIGTMGNRKYFSSHRFHGRSLVDGCASTVAKFRCLELEVEGPDARAAHNRQYVRLGQASICADMGGGAGLSDRHVGSLSSSSGRLSRTPQPINRLGQPPDPCLPTGGRWIRSRRTAPR